MSNVALVASPGGHLTQALAVAQALHDEHRFFVCVTGFEVVRDLQLPEAARVYRFPCWLNYSIPLGTTVSVIGALFEFIRVFRREKPDCIVSTGAEIALPALLVNKLFFRKPSLFIESLSRVREPSLTGRLAARLADRVFVQWPEVAEHYKGKAEYHGRLV